MKKKPETTTYTVRLDADLKQEFETAAHEQDLLPSQILRRLLRQYLTDYRKENQRG